MSASGCLEALYPKIISLPLDPGAGRARKVTGPLNPKEAGSFSEQVRVPENSHPENERRSLIKRSIRKLEEPLNPKA